MNQPQHITVAAFTANVKAIFNVVAIGLSASNPGVPPALLMQVMAAAMGQVLSEATASSDIKATLDMRGKCADAFVAEIRKHVPALQHAAPISTDLTAHG